MLIRNSKNKHLLSLIALIAAGLSFVSLLWAANQLSGTNRSDVLVYIISVGAVIGGAVNSLCNAIMLPKIVGSIQKKEYKNIAHIISQAAAAILAAFAVLIAFKVVSSHGILGLMSQFDLREDATFYLIDILFCLYVPIVIFSELMRSLATALERNFLSNACQLFQPLCLIFILSIGSKSAVAMLIALIFGRVATILAVYFANYKLIKFNCYGCAVGRVPKAAVVYGISTLIGLVYTLSPEYYASGMISGTVVGVAIAYKLMLMPVNILVSPIVDASRASLVRSLLDREWVNIELEVLAIARVVFSMIIPLGVFYITYSESISNAVIRENRSAVIVASNLIQIYGFGMLAISIFMILGKILESSNYILTYSKLTIIGNAFGILLMYFGSNLAGYKGIGWAVILQVVLYMLPMATILINKIGIRRVVLKLINSVFPPLTFSVVIILLSKIFFESLGVRENSAELLAGASSCFASYIFILAYSKRFAIR